MTVQTPKAVANLVEKHTQISVIQAKEGPMDVHLFLYLDDTVITGGEFSVLVELFGEDFGIHEKDSGLLMLIGK